MSNNRVPKVGEWWVDTDKDIVHVVYDAGEEREDRFLVVYRSDCGDHLSLWISADEFLRHLPNCTGFDCEPVKTRLMLREFLCSNNSKYQNGGVVWKADGPPIGWNYYTPTGRMVEVEVPET